MVSTFAVFLVVIASLIGAASASAQSGGGGGGGKGGTTKKVERWVERQAMKVAAYQPAVFPNAEVSGRDSFAACYKANKGRWGCFYNIYIYEDSRTVPDQHTLRLCANWSDDGSVDDALRVARTRRGSGKLSIKGGWPMSCALDQFAIDFWAIFGPAYNPAVTEATPHEVRDVDWGPLLDTSITLPPSGSDTPGPAPGPRTGGNYSARSDESGKAGRPGYAPTFCSRWDWYWYGPAVGWRAVYGCRWDEPTLNGQFGANAGVFAYPKWVEFYMWGNNGYGNQWIMIQGFWTS